MLNQYDLILPELQRLKNKSADVSIIFKRLQNCVKARLNTLAIFAAISTAISSF
jgi:transcriptional regulator